VKLALGLGAFILSVFNALPVAAEPNDGTVAGQVINKTGNGLSTAGATVLLVAFGRKEQAPVGQKTTQTDDQGRYAFTSLDRDANLVYITLARHQNVNYPSDQPFQLQEQSASRADIGVYDTTTSDDAIQLDRLNLIILGAQDGMAQFMEMGALVNSGDRTFVTTNPQDQALARAIKFALPNGALGAQMQSGFNNQDVTTAVGGIQVTSPVPPGRHEFALSFQLPYSGSSADVSLQIHYPTGTYSVYLPDTGLRFDANGLTATGQTQLGGQTYALYSASTLSKSVIVGGQISSLGASGTVPPNQLALITLGVVLCVIGGGVFLFGGRLRRGVATEAPGSVGDPETERLELVVRLAALDERFAAGEVSHSDYEAERDRGKQRLRELTLARRQTHLSAV
jgi:hypothetical protein